MDPSTVAWLQAFWLHLLGAVSVVLSVLATAHILLHKRDTSAALSWTGFVWLVPIIGVLLYVGFGINRIRRRAKLLRYHGDRTPPTRTDEIVGRRSGFSSGDQWSGLRTVLDHVTGTELTTGNRLSVLEDGDKAYPAMLAAIDAAERSIALVTFILGNDIWGRRFVEALVAAEQRGVEVRVLVDGAGQYYTWPPIGRLLRRTSLRWAFFLHSVWPWRMPYINLRNHRKILVIDGHLGFTGGMNLRAKHAGSPPEARDLHFRVEGPVVAQMMAVFADDWAYTCGEALGGEPWFPSLAPVGDAMARGIPDGPDEDYDKFRWALLAGLGQAEHRVLVVTPYFLPDEGLIAAIDHAALRGVVVDILLPGVNNWPFVQWASNPLVRQVVSAGCRVWMTSGPFDHSKYMVVDSTWCLVGSANWDPRSLRLNFEFNLEAYDASLATYLETLGAKHRTSARLVSLASLEKRLLLTRLRDGAARLLTPYL